MAKIVDPDNLTQNVEVTIVSGEKKIQLNVAGNLSDASPGKTSGVTMQALYSFLKEEWKDRDNLNRYKFPLKAITAFKFDWQYEWAPYDQQTRDLIRDGGWKEVGAGAAAGKYACIVTLGDFDADTDQAYYQKVSGFAATTTDFDKTGEVNEAYQALSGENDFTDFLKVFLRVQGKSYSEGNLLVDQGWASVDYDTYRLPISNIDDPNIAASDNTIDTTEPYMSMSVDFLKGNHFVTWQTGVTYHVDDVVFNDARWYRCILEHSSQEPPNGTYWESYPGERLMGTTYYAFNRIIDGATGTTAKIYEWAQRQLRKAGNINADTEGDGFGTVNGKVAKDLVAFVGSNLNTKPGVYIDNFDVNNQNDITMFDITVDGGDLTSEFIPVLSTARTFPYASAGTVTFSQNLVSDSAGKFWMFFADAGGNLFNSNNAIIVNDADGLPISGEINSTSRQFTFDYTYNNQGGRTPNTDAAVVVVAMGLETAEWIYGEFTISRATGLSFPINAADERNYSNPT